MLSVKTIMLAGMLSLGLSKVVVAQPVEFTSTPNTTTLGQAIQSHQAEQFAQSYQEFTELMRLGNGRASTQLGLMTLAEEGTEYDPVKAWAYFQHGGELGFANGASMAEEVFQQLSADQQQAAPAALESLQSQAWVTQRHTRNYRQHDIDVEVPPVKRRRQPRYPEASAYEGEVGFIIARILIDTDGKVAAKDSLFSSNRAFEREAMGAISGWRYEPPAAPIRSIIRLTFEMAGDEDKREPYLRVIEEVSWQQAIAGSPGHQAMQGAFLDTIAPRALTQWVQKDTFSDQPPALADYNTIEDDLVSDHQWPLNWTGVYWYEQAAQAGEPHAQRILADNHDEWEQFLIDRGDARTAAWAASRWLLQDEYPQLRAKGMDFIERLQSSDDRVARDVARTLHRHYSQ
ncbi:MAG: TonB family protein [Idiomarina sp.]|nr:TonB family protein [Idiomarina sp.]